MFRIHLIVAVFLALTCTGLAAAADSPSAPAVSQRPDGRLGPDIPTAADLRTADTPTVIYVDRESTASFDWLDALIGGLVVAGVVLAVGGLLVVRQHSPTLAR